MGKKKSDRTIVVTLDCTKAYDRVWKVRMKERMVDGGVPRMIARWYASFLEGRMARVNVGNGMSKKCRSGYSKEQ